MTFFVSVFFLKCSVIFKELFWHTSCSVFFFFSSSSFYFFFVEKLIQLFPENWIPLHELHEIFEFRCRKRYFFFLWKKRQNKVKKKRQSIGNTYIAIVHMTFVNSFMQAIDSSFGQVFTHRDDFILSSLTTYSLYRALYTLFLFLLRTFSCVRRFHRDHLIVNGMKNLCTVTYRIWNVCHCSVATTIGIAAGSNQ